MLGKLEGTLYDFAPIPQSPVPIGLLCRRLTVYRRTGITLKEGKRDEHGMEEVDGIFSSPEKSPAGENEFDRSESIGSDMSMDEGMRS